MQSFRRRAARAGLGCAAVLLLAAMFGLLVGSLVYVGLVKNLPSTALLPALMNPENGLLMQPTRVFDRSGQKLLYSLENPGIPRRYLSIDPKKADHFSPELIRVVVSTLDPGFWHSPGIDLAHLADPYPRTIAERLVSDLLLWGDAPGLERTVRMRLLAAQTIAQHGHVQTLEWYLNSAYFGHMAFGADSAARLYLDRSAASVDLSQAALLAAVIRAPALNPLDAPAVAREGQQDVLKLLLSARTISSSEYLRAAAVELAFAPPAMEEQGTAGAFSQLVLDRLSTRIGRERLERGGLRVITTLDYDLQLELACLVRTQLSRLTSTSANSQQEEIQLPDGKPCQSMRLLPTLPSNGAPIQKELLSSAVVLNPKTGQVLALLGDTTSQGESGTLSYREPGSLLTPFAAVAGFARGIGPASLVWDIPSSLPEDLASQSNPDDNFHGPVRLRLALANDYLAAQTQLIGQIGAANIWRLAGAMGLSSLAEEKSPGLIYSGGRVSPLQLAQAYGVFASQGNLTGQKLAAGERLQPAVVLYVDDISGNVWLDAHQPETQAVTSPQLSYLVHHVLSDATARWPSLGYPNPLEIGRPSGAKVGQVAGAKQVWAAGYTPDRVAVFWLGLPAESEQQLSPKMAAGMWHALMQYANRGLPVADWPEPPGMAKIDVCDPSGLLPTGACPEVVREIFLSGSEPAAPDNLYRMVQINRETGRLATVFTPAALVEEKVFLIIPFAARTWAEAAGLPLPPQEYDAIQPPAPSAVVNIQSPALYSFVNGEVLVKGTAAGERLRFYQVLVGQGLNPKTWFQIGPDGTSPVEAGVLSVWDTRGIDDGLYAVRLLIARQDQTLETATIQVTVDNTSPLVRIQYPLSGQEVILPLNGAITLQAEASDSIGIDRVAWTANGVEIGASTLSPYSVFWKTGPGVYEIQVTAYDLAGNVGKSEQVQFSVVK